MDKQTGGPAFPSVNTDINGIPIQDGMTLRDYFAAKAISGMLSSADFVDAIANVAALEKISSAQKIAQIAYQTADAMLVERAK